MLGYRSKFSFPPGRTESQYCEHFQVECELADRLRHARESDREALYANVYNELFERLPHHPQLTKQVDEAGRKASIDLQLGLLSQFLRPDAVVAEIGSGDGALCIALADLVRRVYAVDVSKTISDSRTKPQNVISVISDATHFKPEENIEICYSNQLLEHLHPEDAKQHIGCVLDALSPGGVYICVTPNQLTGPHDISRFFSRKGVWVTSD